MKKEKWKKQNNIMKIRLKLIIFFLDEYCALTITTPCFGIFLGSSESAKSVCLWLHFWTSLQQIKTNLAKELIHEILEKTFHFKKILFIVEVFLLCTLATSKLSFHNFLKRFNV